MVIDTSALVAIFLDEPEGADMNDAIMSALVRLVPATCILEARMVIGSRRDADAIDLFDVWLANADLEVVPITADVVEIATVAWLKYGKGRHPAALNFGDCLSYALAAATGEPLLFKGDDFSRTNIARV